MNLALLAQAADTAGGSVTGIGGMVGGGSIAVASITVIWWLIRYYTEQLAKQTDKFDQTIARKDAQIISCVEKAEMTQREIAKRYEELIKEIREDGRHRDTQWTAVNREMTTALEQVTTAMNEIRGAMGELKMEIRALSGRVDALDRPPPPKGRGGG